ncbi:alpha/beta hydrolase [Flavobacterium sp. F372]|uniref:Alpha/beta hydrolase n=1 Tax=Flavobacterium bernardetii TaxID=2813823 RepID=A0ABR7IZ73_9FLAO|nr:alpha/beta fold hydrolase [Flavobacterium bernardetii]MBC5835095.1 alpha/beta hydrolase [Flavobacterium bernardetii]NHF70789.1 alpha/beta hydrolase [Flavobacterium bernardetii]
MKKNSVILFLLLSLNLFSQDIMFYEKEISNKDNYEFYDYSVLQKKDNIKLTGTLITPKANYDKIVFIVPGSGKDTRNSHFILTELLLKNNIAVFRYDERGVGKSEGVFNNNSYTINEMTEDFQSIFNELKTTEKFINKKIGLIGHSYGGLITIGAVEKGLKCDFLIQWATPVERATESLKYQIKTGLNKQEKNLQYSDNETKFKVMDSISKIIDRNATLDEMSLKKVIYSTMKKYGYKKNDFGWYITFSSYLELLKKNFIPVYENIAIPTIYLIGDNDIFVDPVANTSILKKINNKNIDIKVFESLNHYLTSSKNLELNTSLYEIDEVAKTYVLDWIKSK